MARLYDTVSFLSDYGHADEFVGVVKSVIRSIAPHVEVVDITHDVPAHDVRAGSLALVRAAQYLVPGVVLAVVDPGVGTDRRAIAVEVGDEGESVLVGPDNGLLASAVSMSGGARRVVELTNEKFHLPAPGATFAGRDVFAPVVANVCSGIDLTELGDEVDPITLRPGMLPLSRVEEGKLKAEVLWVDHFGNAQLNVGAEDVADYGEQFAVLFGDQRRAVRMVTNYDALRAGEIGALIDSYGLLALSANRTSAAELLKLRPGDAVSFEELQ